eukprot:gnl/MRDRNA2_/MRDRNA2_18433_c0_seq1.p1 gnl/MRDRNA2_/MRDRNA2_18433_c0~~gnl/MRDRNA2_/MRDRNA2_18433_c0_seq1.p1  ORF type:complete len:385 (+),score=52.63 gnl/MRDRNA2_/MRDRNA2_18433_c0_seq1:82-1155(+)
MARMGIVAFSALFIRPYLEVQCAQVTLRREADLVVDAEPPLVKNVEQKAVAPTLDTSYWIRYWFMCPVALCVSICANLSGIGGAAFFAPIFIIGFPLLGPDYELKSPVASVAIALGVELFGFSSGMIGYLRRNLIDFRTAWKFAVITVPSSLAATMVFEYVPILWLKWLYVVLMFCLSLYLLFWKVGGDDLQTKSNADLPNTVRVIVDSDGNSYNLQPVHITGPGCFLTMLGGLLMGFLGVGAGEVTLPQLLRAGYPAAIAAPTSVAVVVATVAATVWVQMSAVVRAGGVNAVPWNILCWMVPTVVVGAQIAAALQGKLQQARMQRAIGVTFAVVGVLCTLALVHPPKMPTVKMPTL